MDWKKLVREVFLLPVWLVLLLSLFSAAALVWVFVMGMDSEPVAYAVYVISFYTLCTLCVCCWRYLPGCYRSIKGRIYSNSVCRRYFTDAAFKTHVGLYRSLIINLLYAIINAASAFWFSTNWFGIFAVYYSILAVMRFLLLRYVSKNHIGHNRMGELERSRLCAYILLTVNLALSGAVLMMVSFNRGFDYPGVLIYVVALYTFYISTAAIVELVKYRRYKSPVMSMAKLIKLAAALVSMLSLETAMFSQFGGDMSFESQRIMLIATGAGVSAVVVGVALYMIVRTSKEIKEIKEL